MESCGTESSLWYRYHGCLGSISRMGDATNKLFDGWRDLVSRTSISCYDLMWKWIFSSNSQQKRNGSVSNRFNVAYWNLDLFEQLLIAIVRRIKNRSRFHSQSHPIKCSTLCQVIAWVQKPPISRKHPKLIKRTQSWTFYSVTYIVWTASFCQYTSLYVLCDQSQQSLVSWIS